LGQIEGTTGEGTTGAGANEGAADDVRVTVVTVHVGVGVISFDDVFSSVAVTKRRLRITVRIS